MKQGWQLKDNPDGIGSSKAFGKISPTQQTDDRNDKANDIVDPEIIAMEAQIIPTQQKATNFELVQQENLARLEGIDTEQNLGSAPSNVEGKQHDDTSTHITPPQAATARLPSTSIHVLEKVTAVEHVNVQHKVMEQTQLGT